MTNKNNSTEPHVRRLLLGMVGGGQGAFIGGVHRIAARLDDRYELVAGALSSDADRALVSASELGFNPDRAYTDFRQMAETESKLEQGIDVVAIVTPNHMHFPVAKAFAEQGIHIICDKPVTRTLPEALELRSLLSTSKSIFALTHNYTGYPMVQHARHMVSNGELGEIRVIQVEYPQDWLTESLETTGQKQAEWRTDPERSGRAGCLGDIGTHGFNLAEFVSNLQVSEVSADLTTFVDGRQLDDNVHVLMRYENGAKGMLWASQVAPGNENGLRLRVYGSKGGIEWAQEDPNYLWFSPFGHATQKLTRGSGELCDAANRMTRIPAGHPEGYLEGFANLYSDIADVIQNNGKTTTDTEWLPDIESGIAGMLFIDAVLLSSSQNGQWTELGNRHS
jgi:predicted dehydrogenase